MRTPDDDGPEDGTVSSTIGDGFGASAGDLTAGFGDDDAAGADDTSFGEGSTTSGIDFGDGLSDAEARNVLVEILEDVFGDDAPDVLDNLEDATGLGSGELHDALGKASALAGDADGFDPTGDDPGDASPFDLDFSD